MEAYRFQELVYLIIPVMVGMEFFMTARAERKGTEETPVGSYVLDFFGFAFTGVLPALFVFTIWAVEGNRFHFSTETLARLDRYAVMFFFMGSWWQVYMIGALRARRLRKTGFSDWYVWLPYLVLGTFISLLVLWVSPWGLMWVSIFWFLFTFGVLKGLKVKPKNVERVFWALCIITFVSENILFVWLDAIV